MESLFYRILRRVLLLTFIYFVLHDMYHNLCILKGMYDKMLQYYSVKYKHTSYIYDCLYASCFHENNYITCKCLL